MGSVKMLIVLFLMIDAAFAQCAKFVGLNSTEQILKLSKSQITLDTVKNDDLKTFKEKCITFEKSLGSRGFYIQVADDGGEDQLDLKFMTYGGYEMGIYDFYWEKLEKDDRWKSNYVRGAHKLQVSLSSTGQSATIHLFEIKWIMTRHNMLVIMICVLAHLIYTLVLLQRAGFIECCKVLGDKELSSDLDDDDNYQRVDTETGQVKKKAAPAPKKKAASPAKNQKGAKAKNQKVAKAEEEEQQVDITKPTEEYLIKSKSPKMKKMKIQQWIKFILQVFDLVSDILYIATVPAFHKAIQILLIASLLLPVLMIVCVQRRSFGYTKMQTLAAVFGALPLYELYQRRLGPKELTNLTMRQSAPFVLEDGPQFTLQVANSMLVGNSWSWVQVVSPIFSLKGIAYRFINRKTTIGTTRNQKMKGGQNVGSIKSKVTCWNAQVKATFYVNLFCIVPVCVFALWLYNYTDQRPEWAKQFHTIRWGTGEKAYPAINPGQTAK